MIRYYKMEQRDSFDMHKTRTVYRIKHNGRVNGEKFIEKVAHRRGYSESVIQGVLMDVADELIYLLGEGRAVTVPGIGSFSLGVRLKEERQRQVEEDTESGGSVTEPNARNLELHHLNFRKDKELFRQVSIRFSRQTLQREGGRQGRRITIDDSTQRERINKAHEFLREHAFMHVGDYAELTGLSYSSAQRELKELARFQHSGITIEGRGSHRVYVLRKEEG